LEVNAEVDGPTVRETGWLRCNEQLVARADRRAFRPLMATARREGDCHAMVR